MGIYIYKLLMTAVEIGKRYVSMRETVSNVNADKSEIGKRHLSIRDTISNKIHISTREIISVVDVDVKKPNLKVS